MKAIARLNQKIYDNRKIILTILIFQIVICALDFRIFIALNSIVGFAFLLYNIKIVLKILIFSIVMILFILALLSALFS